MTGTIQRIPREQIVQEAHKAAAMKGASAENPYAVGTPAHDEWQACFERALASDEFEGSLL